MKSVFVQCTLYPDGIKYMYNYLHKYGRMNGTEREHVNQNNGMAVRFDHYLATRHWTIENISAIFGSQVNIWRICLLFFRLKLSP